MKNNHIKIYGIFLICFSIINPAINLYVARYYMPLAAIFSIPSLSIILTIFIIPGIYFYRIGSSPRLINKMLIVSAIMGGIVTVFVTLNMLVSLVSVFGSGHISIFGLFFSFLPKNNGLYVMIIYCVSIITLIAGVIMRYFEKNDITTPEPIVPNYKPHARSVITLLGLVVILGVFIFISDLSGQKKDNYILDQTESNTPLHVPINTKDNTSTRISTDNSYTTVEQGACQPLSSGDEEKFDNFLRSEDMARYDFNLPGVGIINLASNAWRKELLDKGGDPSSYRFSQSTPHIKFMDLNGDCQYDAVVTIVYSEPVYQSEDDQFPKWVSRPLLYVFLNNGGIFTPLDHVKYENGMVIDSVSGSGSTLAINMEFPIEKGGNLRTRKLSYEVSSGKLTSTYDSFDDITTWSSAWESGVDRISGVTFKSPPGWGAVSVSSEKPPTNKEEELAEIKSGHIPLLSGISHTISFALDPSTVTVYSRDYREKPLSELPADLVQQYLTKKSIVKNQDDYLRQPTSFQCLSDDLDTKSALLRCDISYQKDKNVIVRAGVIGTDVRYPPNIITTANIAPISTNTSYGFITAKSTLPVEEVLAEYLPKSLWEDAASLEGAGLVEQEWSAYYNMTKNQKSVLGKSFNRFNEFISSIEEY